jgi:hypothetical protein
MSGKADSEAERLAQTINEQPDSLHGDYTPAVHALVRLGLAALPVVVPLLESEDRFTRLRAQRVLEGVTREWVKRSAAPKTRPGATYRWRALWSENGDYDWQADAAARAASVTRWREWLRRAQP